MAVGLFIQACAPKLTPQESCNFVMNNDKQRVSWGPQTPVTMYVDSSFPSEYFDAVKSAVNTWNGRMGREVLKVGGWTNSYPNESQDGVNIIYWRKNSWPDPHDKQAITTIYWAADRIFEADIRINNTKDFDYFWGPPVSGKVDVESLLLHELGHVLGLSHQEVGGSVMAMRLENAVERRSPAELDINDLKCEY